jgi:cytidylate kinase
MKKIIIAVDGLSSCGKSTMAKTLARTIEYTYIDTGAMYRAVTLYALQQGLFTDETLDIQALENAIPDISIFMMVNPETGRTETFLNGINVEKEIRGMEVAARVSLIASQPFVRDALVCQQRLLGHKRGIVMDGRDIGTVVFPDAELKIFVTASAEVRARRRLDELQSKDEKASFEEILENVKSRDYQDMTRSLSPLRKADDAVELDNTNMTIEEQNSWMIDKYNSLMISLKAQ